MRANKARELTIEGQGGMHYIYSQIREAADSGYSSCTILDTAMTEEQAAFLRTQQYSVLYESALLEWEVKW